MEGWPVFPLSLYQEKAVLPPLRVRVLSAISSRNGEQTQIPLLMAGLKSSALQSLQGPPGLTDFAV